MSVFRDAFEAIRSPLNIILKYKSSGKILFSLLTILLTSVLNGVAAPIVYYAVFGNVFVVSLEPHSIIIMFCMCIATYFISCGAFRLMALLFKKDVSFLQIFSTWGFSYIPTLLCAVFVNITEIAFYYFMGNTVLLLLGNTLLIMLLIWKAIFYFIELNVVLGIKGSKAVIATFAIGLIFLAVMSLGFRLGLKVPAL